MLQAAKDCFRRWQVTRRLTCAPLTVNTLTAGERSGVWTVCPDLLNRDSIIYSFGVGDNIAWDLAMIDGFGLTVHAFDPTPTSVKWLAEQGLPSNFHFHPIGLAGHDGVMNFALPGRGSRSNFRPAWLLGDRKSNIVAAPVGRLESLMSRLGHDHLDVLKLDIEGCEYAALTDILAHPIPVKQLLIEFHHHFRGIGIKRTEQIIRALQAAGFRHFHISGRGLEMSFVRDP